MKTPKLILSITSSILLVSTLAYAKKDYSEEYNKYENQKKDYKEHKKYKKLPHGLEKKVHRDGKLPPGWKKKYEKGQVLDSEDIKYGKVIHSDKYPDIKGTKIYEIQDKIIRVGNATREILEVFK